MIYADRIYNNMYVENLYFVERYFHLDKIMENDDDGLFRNSEILVVFNRAE